MINSSGVYQQVSRLTEMATKVLTSLFLWKSREVSVQPTHILTALNKSYNSACEHIGQQVFSHYVVVLFPPLESVL